MPNKVINEYKKLFSLVRPYLHIFSLGMGCIILTTIFNGLNTSAIVPFLDTVIGSSKTIMPYKLPQFIQKILDSLYTIPKWPHLIGYFAVFMVVIMSLRCFFQFLQDYFMSDVGQLVMRDMRNKLYSKYQSLPLGYFSQKRSGELVSRITNDILLLENAVSYGLRDIMAEGAAVVVFTFIAFSILWKIAIFAFVLVPLIAIPMVIVGKKIRKLSSGMQEKMADINALLYETISGVRVVRAFNMQDYERDKFEQASHRLYKLNMKAIKRKTLLPNATEIIGNVVMMGILAYVGKMVFVDKTVSWGTFGLFIASLAQLIRPFKKLSSVNAIMQQAFSAADRIQAVLISPPEIEEKTNALVLTSEIKTVQFEGVWFKYEDTDVLKGINFTVNKGEVLAIVGPSGAGKTTMVDLIPRFYNPQKGFIRINGMDTGDFSLDSLRKQIAIVTQETILFNDTIKANIAYGQNKASDAEVFEAAKKAFAHDFISGLPQGYDTMIGDRGVKLSGGERQRIAIARAILKNAPILILDEATSQLDTQSERMVQQAISVLMEGRTVFVIAHRLSTVQNANKIIVLSEGVIKEEGTHSQLLGKQGLYRKLYEIQFMPM